LFYKVLKAVTYAKEIIKIFCHGPNLTFNDLPEAVTRLTDEVSKIKHLLIQKQVSPTKEAEKLLTIKEASEFLKLTVPTIYSKVSKNELPYMKQGKRLYFSKY